MSRFVDVGSGEDLGALIRVLRAEAGLTQAGLAEAAGWSRARVIELEAGRVGTYDRLIWLLAELGCGLAVVAPDVVDEPKHDPGHDADCDAEHDGPERDHHVTTAPPPAETPVPSTGPGGWTQPPLFR